MVHLGAGTGLSTFRVIVVIIALMVMVGGACSTANQPEAAATPTPSNEVSEGMSALADRMEEFNNTTPTAVPLPTSTPQPSPVSTTVSLPPSIDVAPAQLVGRSCDKLAVGLSADRCAFLQVTETHAGRSTTFELPVAIFEATGERVAEQPVVYLHGGPGLVDIMTDLVGTRPLTALSSSRDVVVLGQRGSTERAGGIDCPLDEWMLTLLVSPDRRINYRQRLPAVIAECSRAAEQRGAVPAAYSAISMADDVAALASALGYEQIDLHGVSYGGQIAQVVMSRHPQIVRSAVLDSPLAINVALVDSRPHSLLDALGHLSRDCEVDPACSDRFQFLKGRVLKTIDELNEQPVAVNFFETDLDGTVSKVEILADGALFAGMVNSALYNPSWAASIPDILDDTDDNNTLLLSRLWTDLAPYAASIDLSEIWTLCADEVRSIERVLLSPTGTSTDRLTEILHNGGPTLVALCRNLELDLDEVPMLTEPAAGQIPTLVLGGALDPITPVSDLRPFAGRINASYVEFRGLAHSVEGNFCADRIERDFLDEPHALLDTTCAGRLTPLAFANAPLHDDTEGAEDTTIERESRTINLDERSFELFLPAEWTSYGESAWREDAPYDETRISLQIGPGAAAVERLTGLSGDTRAAALDDLFIALYDYEVTTPPGIDDQRFADWTLHAVSYSGWMTHVRADSIELGIALTLSAYPDEITDLVDQVLAPAVASISEPVAE